MPPADLDLAQPIKREAVQNSVDIPAAKAVPRQVNR
jgi:hypothetical protein